MDKNKNKLLVVVLGENVLGINEEYSALKSLFYFKAGNKYIPGNGFIGCPNATLVWLLKAARLISNESYEEREVVIYGSEYCVTFKKPINNRIDLIFYKNKRKVLVCHEEYDQLLAMLLDAAIRSYDISSKYEYSTMAEQAIVNEIRLMKKHINNIRYDKYEET